MGNPNWDKLTDPRTGLKHGDPFFDVLHIEHVKLRHTKNNQDQLFVTARSTFFKGSQETFTMFLQSDPLEKIKTGARVKVRCARRFWSNGKWYNNIDEILTLCT